MIRAHLPDGRILNFPDGTDPAVVQAAVKRATAAASAPPLVPPQADMAAGLYMANTFPRVEEKRAQLAGIQAYGDIDRPSGMMPAHAPTNFTPPPEEPLDPPKNHLIPLPVSPRDAKRAELEEMRESGDVTPYDIEDPGYLRFLGEAVKEQVAGPAIGLRDRQQRLAQGFIEEHPILARGVFQNPVLGAGLAASAIPLQPEGLRENVREGYESVREDYLAADPSDARAWLAGGTELAAGVAPFLAAPSLNALQGGPVAATAGQAAVRLAGRLSPTTFEVGSAASRLLARGVGGAIEGGVVGLGNADPDAPWQDQAQEIGLSAALGGGLGALGGAQEVSRLADQGRFYPSGREVHGPPMPPPKEVRQATMAAFEEAKATALADLPPEAHPAVLADVEAQWQATFAAGGAAGDRLLGGMADQLQARKAPEIKAPPPLPEGERLAARHEYLTGQHISPEEALAQREAVRASGDLRRRLVAPDRPGQPLPPPPPGLAPGDPWIVGPGRADLLRQGGFDGPLHVRPPDAAPAAINREAGFIQFGRNKPPAPPPDPAEAVMPRNEPTPPPQGPLGALQAAADRVTDQFLNREDALPRRLRRAGHKAEADFIEQLQGRARGAGGMIDPQRKAGPVFEGTYVYDPNLYGPGKFGSRRTGDGLEAVVGGLDDNALWDMDKLAAARRHLQLADRQAQAQLQYDWGRAQRLEELRQSRRADKASLQAMFGDIRAARADELRAVRRVSKAEMETRVREVVVRQETARVEDLGDRAGAVRGKALDAAQASRAAGGELSARSQETAQAALYARQLLRQELRAAVRTPRPGEIPPLDTSVGPRSPSAVFEADQMAVALRRVAERLGVAEGSLHTLLEGAGELEALGRQAARSAGRQAQQAGQAWSRLGQALPEEAAARQRGNRSIGSAQRVAMGIRDAATHRVPTVERPADIDLDIDPRGTTVAREILADLEARYGVEPDSASGASRIRQLEEQVDRFRDWTVRAWMIPLKEAGRFSDQEFRYWQNPDGSYEYAGDILAKNDLYAPFQRLMEVLGDEADVYGLSPVASGKPNPVHAITGGLSPDRPIARPVMSAVEIAQKAILWTERQRVRNVFADAVDSSPELQAEIRRLSPTGGVRGVGPKTGLPIHVRGSFPAWRNGVRTDYTAPPDVLRAVESMTPGQTSVVMEAAKLAARTLRAGATITLEFPFRNLGRDVQDAAVYGPGYNPVFKVLVDPVAGLLDVLGLGGGRWSKEMRANGGFLSGAVDSLRPQIEATIRDVTGQRGKVRARYESEIGGRFGERMSKGIGSAATALLKTAFFPILAPMETLASGLESTAKVGAYRRMRLRGAGAGEAAVAARSVASPDFGQAGSFVREWNGIEAFVNAEFQDLNRFGRAMRRNPGSTTIKALAYLTLPAIANWYKNKDDEEYQRLPDWERIAFYHPAKLDDGRWVRIPRPLGMLNVAFSYGPQKLLERMAGEDPDAVEELGKAFVASTPLHFLPQRDTLTEGGHMDWLPSIAQPLAEVSAGPAGYSSHRQGPIDTTAVYPGSAPLPEDRVRDQTSGIARAAGKAFGVSPIKVDYLLQGYGAYWGRTLAQATGPLARAAGADPAASDTLMGRMAQGGSPQLPTTASDIPGVRGFISSPAIGFGADPVVKLYKLATSVRESVRSKDLAVERKDLTRYHAVLREHPEFRLDGQLKDDLKYLAELRKKRNEILDQPGLSDEIRLDLILSIDQRAAAFAGQRMHLYSDMLHDEK